MLLLGKIHHIMKSYNKAFVKIILISGALLSQSVFSAGLYNNESRLTNNERLAFIQNCGHFDEVGPSSIFGVPSEYNKIYPTLGYLSAELDRVAKVDSGTRKTVQTIFQDAKDKWVRLEYSLDKNKKLLRRSETEVNTTHQIKDNTMRVFESSQGQLAKEQQFVLQKAHREVLSKLQADTRFLGRDQNVSSSMDELNSCRQWWKIEQMEVPQWKKNGQTNPLNDIKGKNHGYGVESTFGDGRSSNKNAKNNASTRQTDRSSRYSNSPLERFEYDYTNQSRPTNSSSSKGNGGLEMQW